MKTVTAILGVMVLSTGISSAAGAKSGGKGKPSDTAKKAETAAPSARAPFAEVRRLGEFVGTWKISGQMQKSPMGPGGKTTATQTCSWFDGEYFLVCHTDGTTPMGKSKGMSVFGWDADHQNYTFFSIDSMGMTSSAKGKADGKTWTWMSEEKMSGKTVKSRFVMTQESADRNRMTWSISPDGQTWSELFSADETREKAAAKKKAK